MKFKQVGFTLIELMILITILATLVAIAKPIITGDKIYETQIVGITPIMSQTLYYDYFDQDIVVITSASQGDFIIINNGLTQYNITTHIDGFCEVSYIDDYASMNGSRVAIKQITSAECE